MGKSRRRPGGNTPRVEASSEPTSLEMPIGLPSPGFIADSVGWLRRLLASAALDEHFEAAAAWVVQTGCIQQDLDNDEHLQELCDHLSLKKFPAMRLRNARDTFACALPCSQFDEDAHSISTAASVTEVKSMGGWTACQFTEEQQTKYGCSADGKIIDRAVLDSALAKHRKRPHWVCGPHGPPWWILNVVTPGAPDKDMGGWTACQFTEEQQERYGCNGDGKIVDQAVHDAAFAKRGKLYHPVCGPHAPHKPPWWILNDVKPGAPDKDMGGWTACQFTEEQQTKYGCNADGKM